MTKTGSSTRRPAGMLAALVLSLLTAFAGTGAGATPANTKSPANSELAAAMAESSLVYVQVNWKGWIVLPNNVSYSPTEYMPAGSYGPYTAVTSCSGFVASSSGDIVTAGHCVDDQSFDGGKEAILAASRSHVHTAGGKPLPAAQWTRLADSIRTSGRVEGYDSGSPVERTVRITVPSLSATAHPANVVDVKPFANGDVALLRATNIAAPALPVAQTPPENGQAILAAGYPGAVAQVVDAKAAGSYKTGEISGSQTVNGTPFTEISAAESAGMSGGPVLDTDGQVVGTVSWAPRGATSFNFVTDTGTIRSLLARNGVSATLGTATDEYRQGLASYFDQEYHRAVGHFDDALALRPSLHAAQQWRAKAIANYPNDVAPPSSGLPVWSYGAIGAAALVLVGGAAMLLIRRRRRSMLESAAVRPAERAEESPVHVEAPAAPVAGTPRREPGLRSVPATAHPVDPEPRDEDIHLFCPDCGAPHAKDTRYCERCGHALSPEVALARGDGTASE